MNMYDMEKTMGSPKAQNLNKSDQILRCRKNRDHIDCNRSNKHISNVMFFFSNFDLKITYFFQTQECSYDDIPDL